MYEIGKPIGQYAYTNLENNSFKVYGTPGKFSWHVFGMRKSIVTEPHKSVTTLKGTGPYTWLE